MCRSFGGIRCRFALGRRAKKSVQRRFVLGNVGERFVACVALAVLGVRVALDVFVALVPRRVHARDTPDGNRVKRRAWHSWVMNMETNNKIGRVHKTRTNSRAQRLCGGATPQCPWFRCDTARTAAQHARHTYARLAPMCTGGHVVCVWSACQSAVLSFVDRVFE